MRLVVKLGLCMQLSCIALPSMAGGAEVASSSANPKPLRNIGFNAPGAADDPFSVYRLKFADGYEPAGILAVDDSGVAYGTTAGIGRNHAPGVIFSIDPPSSESADWTYTILHKYLAKDPYTGGASGLTIVGKDIYGTTPGLESQSKGTIFRLAKSENGWTYKIVHSFMGADGANPSGWGMRLASDGTLYGVTRFGGAEDAGVFFKYTPAGGLSIIHNFRKNEAEGFTSPLHFGIDGALYGTTGEGGRNGAGFVYRLTTTGEFTKLHSFDKSAPPSGEIAIDQAGVIYGTTDLGGPSNAGSAWSLTPASGKPWKFEVIYSYPSAQGSAIAEGLVRDAANNLYGARQSAIYRLSPPSKPGASWNYNTLRRITGPDGSGLNPIILKGNLLYGTAFRGGSIKGGCAYYSRGCGTIFTYRAF